MTLDQLTDFLRPHFPRNSFIHCSGSLYHVTVTIIDEQFEGLSALKRQQAIYRVLSPLIADKTLHAVTLILRTSAEHSDIV